MAGLVDPGELPRRRSAMLPATAAAIAVVSGTAVMIPSPPTSPRTTS